MTKTTTRTLTTAAATRQARKALGTVGLADVRVTSRPTSYTGGRYDGCVWTDVFASHQDVDKADARIHALKTLDHVEVTLLSDDHIVVIRRAWS